MVKIDSVLDRQLNDKPHPLKSGIFDQTSGFLVDPCGPLSKENLKMRRKAMRSFVCH